MVVDISCQADVRNPDNAGIRRRIIVRYTGPASYETGGDSHIGADIWGMGKVEYIPSFSMSDGTNIYLCWWDKANSKIMWFDPAAGTEVVATTDLSGFTGWVEAAGQ